MIFRVRTGGGSSTPVYPDWNENNALSPSYIKNRPMYYRDDQAGTQVLFSATPLSSISSDALAVDMSRDLFVSYEIGGLSEYTPYTVIIRDGNTAYTKVFEGPTDVRQETIYYTQTLSYDVISVGDKYSDYREDEYENYTIGFCMVNGVVYVTDTSLLYATFQIPSGTLIEDLTIECTLYGPLLPVTAPRELLPGISDDIHDIRVVRVSNINDLSGLDFTQFQTNDLVLIASDSASPITWTVDSELSSTSENPVQNKVIYQQLQDVQAQSIAYTTTAPTGANTDGLKFAVLSSEPATRYSGWIYIITN